MTPVAQLDLLAGEFVEVRSAAEILSTLDEEGTLEGVPFMPEMLAYCGQQHRVFKRADKTCDTVNWTGLRRMERTVHLANLRCDGSAHAGCQAGCLLFWKEAWLKRSPAAAGAVDGPSRSETNGTVTPVHDCAWLETTVYRIAPQEGEVRYRCQATELPKASCPLPWWEPKQYVRDVTMNKISPLEVLRSIGIAAYSKILRRLTGRSYPHLKGTLKRTPIEKLGLEPGDWVVVKTKDEILSTLDATGRNRGLTFDAEMLPYCGKRFRVLRRVERLIEETTGRVVELPGVAIILESVICTAHFRRSCPRSIFPYWREIWLRRDAAGPLEAAPASCAAEPTMQSS